MAPIKLTAIQAVSMYHAIQEDMAVFNWKPGSNKTMQALLNKGLIAVDYGHITALYLGNRYYVTRKGLEATIKYYPQRAATLNQSFVDYAATLAYDIALADPTEKLAAVFTAKAYKRMANGLKHVVNTEWKLEHLNDHSAHFTVICHDQKAYANFRAIADHYKAYWSRFNS